MKKNFPHYSQLDAMDCGPSCLRMIAQYYAVNIHCRPYVKDVILRVWVFLCWELVMRRKV